MSGDLTPREQTIHDRAFLVGQIEAILSQHVSDEEKIRQVRRAIAEPPKQRQVRKDSRGWIEFGDGAVVDLPDEGNGS